MLQRKHINYAKIHPLNSDPIRSCNGSPCAQVFCFRLFRSVVEKFGPRQNKKNYEVCRFVIFVIIESRPSPNASAHQIISQHNHKECHSDNSWSLKTLPLARINTKAEANILQSFCILLNEICLSPTPLHIHTHMRNNKRQLARVCVSHKGTDVLCYQSNNTQCTP